MNIGRFEGGEAINARTRHAIFDVDLRADDSRSLDRLASRAGRIFSEMAESCDVQVESIGARPAGRIALEHPRVAAAAVAQRAFGYEPQFTAASTDANAAHAAGIPAIAIGVTEGAEEHTPHEWIALPPLSAGLARLARTIVDFDGGRR